MVNDMDLGGLYFNNLGFVLTNTYQGIPHLDLQRITQGRAPQQIEDGAREDAQGVKPALQLGLMILDRGYPVTPANLGALKIHDVVNPVRMDLMCRQNDPNYR